ncbi:hypothetical protein [Nocardia donostiensis]|uniref:hypothetical protein n=1 Tax=Nocardia donostiensis TaxID=1538463 RepID=UPI0011155A52|nr:hypothetical protein [Nocardia donostiensis]
MPGLKKIWNFVGDWPGVVTGVIVVVAASHAIVARSLGWPWILPPNAGKVESSVVVSVYLGVASVGAIYAGFAGVIIVFGLTPSSRLFRNFRIQAGARMVSNWISIISWAFLAAGGSLVASFLESIGFRFVASFLFEFGVMLLIHSSIRSVWIMRLLLELVRVDDSAARQVERTERFGSPFS